MTSGPSSLGGLYVTVNLDVTQALRQLARFDAAAKAAMRSLTLPGGRGMGQAATQLNQVAKAVNNVASSTKNASASMRGFQQSAIKLGGYTRVSTGVLREFEREARRLGNTQSIVRGLTTAGTSLSNFRAELGNAAAILAPGRAGTAIYGLNALGRSLSQLGGAGLSAGAVAGLGAVTIGVVALGAALIGTTAALGKFLQVGFESGRAFETLTVSMETLLGGVVAAEQEINTLVAMSAVSPFLTETIVNMDKFLISQGLVAGGLRQGLIQAVIDMGAALGLADDQLGSITYALAQVQARGYLSGDELRQLANQFVPVWNMLAELPELAGKSRIELRKLAEEGAISAQMFFEAFTLYSQRYADAAAKQALTLSGTILNLRDVIESQIGLAFTRIDTSPLHVLQQFLQSILDIARQIDFGPITAALGELFSSIFGGFSAEASPIVNFFQVTLPQAILGVAAVIKAFYQVWLGLWEVIRQVGLAFRDAGVVIGSAIAIAFAAGLTAMHAFVGGLGILVGVVRYSINIILALFNLLTGNIEGAQRAWDGAISGLQASVSGFAGVMAAPLRAIQSTLGVVKALGAIDLPKVGTGLSNVGNGLSDVAGGMTDMGQAGQGGGGGGATKSIDELARIMDSLYDLTVRWFGLRSKLEEGLLGSEGFTASIDSIAQMGRTLVTALRDLGAPEIANLIERSTYALIGLARRREELAKDLDEANKRLEEAISARDRFAEQIRESSIAFANALELETETQTRFRMVSARGFFIQEETEKQKSFVQSLRERVKALKDFLTNMKALRDRGLDEGLLQQLLVAGPEQAGEIAKGLVEGGQAMIGEVNTLQRQVKGVSDALADYGAETFYQAGVDQAQALVDGLEGEMSKIEATAEAITSVVYAAVEPWAQKLEQEASAAGAAAGAGLATGIPAVGGAMGGMTSKIAVSADRWDFMMQGYTGAAQKSLGTGLDGWLGELDTFSAEALEGITIFRDSAIGILEQFKIEPQFEIDLRRLRYEFFDQLVKWLDSIPDVIKGVLFPAYAALRSTLLALRGSYPGGGGATGGGSRGAGGRGATQAMPQGLGGTAIPAFQEGGIFQAANRQWGYAILHHGEMVIPASITDALRGLVRAQATRVSGEINPPQVNVFIGDQELRGMVRTEIVYTERDATTRVVRGRRN